MITEDRQRMIERLGFNTSSLFLLEKYIQLLWSANEELNLVSRKMTQTDLIDNHVIDSLLPLNYFPTDAQLVADFGSGGGLPAIIYAIQFPKTHFHLFEKSPKKQIFLNSCQLIVPNITVHSEIPVDFKNYDLVTARGFKAIDVILDVSRGYYKDNGRYFLLKGRAEKIQEELGLASKKFKDLKTNVIKLDSPVLQVERHLVQIGFK